MQPFGISQKLLYCLVLPLEKEVKKPSTVDGIAVDNESQVQGQRGSDTASEYNMSHNHDVNMALRRLQTTATVTSDSSAPLSTLLVSKGKAFHLPRVTLPKKLFRKSVVSETEIMLGKHVGKIRKELGRGAYGIIFLMEISSGQQQHDLAIKVQSQTDSLAWEFEVLKRLESRFPMDAVHLKYSFPRPFSIVSLADGGIMSMSAASKSGLNLVDLSNFYKLKFGEVVPEIVALHYTSVALKIVEELHWDGMILVRISGLQLQQGSKSTEDVKKHRRRSTN
jgi:hypothetical protein